VEDRLAGLEAAVEQLSSTVRLLEQRVGLLESHGAGPAAALPGVPPSAVAETAVPKAARPARAPDDPIAVLSLIGRLFLVLAGGFFLRAMTEAGLLIAPVGVSLAFTYGLVWLYFADRAGRREQSLGAAFHAAGFAAVAFPLLIEATTRFQVLPPAGAALGLAFLSVAGLWVAWRRGLTAVAWITILAALPTALVLLLKTGQVLPFALQPIALGVAALWLGYVLGWNGIRWPAALVANLVVVGLTLRALSPQYPGTLPVAMLLQWLLLGGYAASIMARTILRGREVGWFEVGQTIAVLLVTVGGTLVLSWSSPARLAAVGLVSVSLGGACYAIVFAVLEKRESVDRNLHFYAGLALVFTLVGFYLMVPAPWSGIAFAVLAVAGSVLWARLGRLYLLLHAGVYLVAAIVASGDLAYGARALGTAPAGPWTQPGAALLLVLAASLACVWFVAARPAPEGGSVASGLRLLVILACAWVVAGCLTGWVAPAIAALTGQGIDPGALATERTAVLALGTLLVAWIGRHDRFREWSWLVYPLLVVTGLKMVAQDFGQSRPATLFIALALYGAALIIAPRLRRPFRAPPRERREDLEGAPAS
jgi:hypothetical protein